MIPGGRIQSAIELVDEFEKSARQGGLPADKIVQNYFRARRYAGSGDRKTISGLFYSILRNRMQLLQWGLESKDPINGRILVITYLAKNAKELLNHFTGDQYCPKPLTDQEKAYLIGIMKEPKSDKSFIQLNCPEWLMNKFIDQFGEQEAIELVKALNDRAPLDVRINQARTERETMIAALEEHHIKTSPMPHTPYGLRFEKQLSLGTNKQYNNGLIEIQDQAAQIASLLVMAEPGMEVMDLCAGGGGKTLAIAADMRNKGYIHAFDIAGAKLKDLTKRALRGKVKNITIKKLADNDLPKDREKVLAAYNGNCDRVVLDVPCSGTGTWRRNPDLRFKFTQTKLDKVTDTQMILLGEGADYVKPGGRLIYMTCSLLKDENEEKVEEFLKFHEDFKLLPYLKIWLDSWGECPKTAASNKDTLLLTPKTHQTDGFFVAVFEKLS